MTGREVIVLASASPHRREICELLGLHFEVIPAHGEPLPDAALPIEKAVLRVARAKAEEVAAACPGRIVVGADTVVEAAGRILGKPADAEDARRMLRLLQGRIHRVLTGVWVCAPMGCDGFTEAAQVEFYPMDEADIDDYLATGEPMDKAGAYGIQGRGMRYVRGIHGDFYTVMGLPGARLLRFLSGLAEHPRRIPGEGTASRGQLCGN